jgi:high-affinity iron transporter
MGVGAAILLSAAFGGFLTFTQSSLLTDEKAQEAFAGFMSLIAVALVTWMIIWMRNTGARLSLELQSKLAQAMSVGALAVAGMAFMAVAREGLETTLFFFAAVAAAGSTVEPVIGFTLGIAIAAALGWLLYLRAVRINLKKFFTITGHFLIFVAAGVLTYAVHELQEAGIIPGEDSLAFDVSGTVSPESWFGALAKGIFNFNPATTWFEAIAWTGYVVFAIWIFNRPRSTTKVGLNLQVRKSESTEPKPSRKVGRS